MRLSVDHDCDRQTDRQTEPPLTTIERSSDLRKNCIYFD